MKKGEISDFHRYLCRSMQKYSNRYLFFLESGRKRWNSFRGWKGFTTVVHTAPKNIYESILIDFIKWGCLTKINENYYRINFEERKCQKCLNKIKNNTFIIDYS